MLSDRTRSDGHEPAKNNFYLCMRNFFPWRVEEHWNSCSGRGWSLPFWKHPKATWTCPCVSRWPCLGQGWDRGSPELPLNTLWFCGWSSFSFGYLLLGYEQDLLAPYKMSLIHNVKQHLKTLKGWDTGWGSCERPPERPQNPSQCPKGSSSKGLHRSHLSSGNGREKPALYLSKSCYRQR